MFDREVIPIDTWSRGRGREKEGKLHQPSSAASLHLGLKSALSSSGRLTRLSRGESYRITQLPDKIVRHNPPVRIRCETCSSRFVVFQVVFRHKSLSALRVLREPILIHGRVPAGQDALERRNWDCAQCVGKSSLTMVGRVLVPWYSLCSTLSKSSSEKNGCAVISSKVARVVSLTSIIFVGEQLVSLQLRVDR